MCGSVIMMLCVFFIFFVKQKTAYEMRISDWSSDVCSSDLFAGFNSWRSVARKHVSGIENAQELTSSIGQERRLSSGAAFAHGARAMSRTTPQAGFTLHAVLVAMAIIAVHLSAAVRVAGVVTKHHGLCGGEVLETGRRR